MYKTCYYVVFVILIQFTVCYGFKKATLNPNTANLNILLSESGHDPLYAQESPVLPQGSQNNNEEKLVRVHDLVNFYNNQGKVISPQSKPPSVSTVAVGSKSQIASIPLNNKNTPSILPKSQTGTAEPTHDILPNLGHSVTSQHRGPLIKVTSNAPLPVPSIPNKLSTKPTYSQILGGKRPSSASTVNNSGKTRPQSPVNPVHMPSFSSVMSGGSSINSSTTGQIYSSTISRPTTGSVLPSALANQGQLFSNAPSDAELQSLSEELLRKDTNNAAKLITVNYQEKTTSQSKEDKALLPLFNIPASVYKISTIEKFIPLLDNYERDTLVNEYVTPQERNEENAFMDTIMQTQVIRNLMAFFKERGYVTPDPRQQRDFLKQLWFNLYSRGKGKISSSGFEHVFVSELKNGEVSGLHNWLYFAQEETANRANYLGFLRYTQLNDKGSVLKLHFNQQNVDKPVDSMFVGTSPELEIALYSLCFVTRADRDCPLKLGGKDINIVTHTFRYRSKNMIGSAYPQI